MAGEEDPRVFLSAEQNYLAWIRTGIALMGFGFVLARFGVFLQQFQIIVEKQFPERAGVSVWFGVALVIIGVIVNVAATARHVRLVRNLQTGHSAQVGVSKLGIIVATLLACVGLASAIYLLVISLRPGPTH
jgi:inner membrane protein YidH